MHYSPNAPSVAPQETSTNTDHVRVEKKERFFQKIKVLAGFLFIAFLFVLSVYFVLNTRENDKELNRQNLNKGRDSESLNSDFIINSLLNSKRGKKFILSKLEELIVSYEKGLNATDEKTEKRDYENVAIRAKHIRSGNQNDILNQSAVETTVQNMKRDDDNDNKNNSNGDVILPIFEQGKIWNVSFVLDNLDGVVAFDNFMKTFQKKYETLDEKHKRFTNFMYNYLKVKEHNSKEGVHYKTGINKFFDMSYEEFRAKYLTLKPFQSTDMGGLNVFFSEESTDALIEKYKKKRLQQKGISGHEDVAADSDSDGHDDDDDDDLMVNYDWRNYNVAKNIKDQGNCGSCWAFSAVAAIEAQYMISKQIDVELSEQQLLDCSKENHGCSGGLLDLAFKYVLSSKGLCTEKDYPYSESAKFVCLTGRCKEHYPISNMHHVSIDQLKKAIRHIGPISVDIYVEDSFVFYTGGIFEGDCAEDEDTNHAILAVGYGKTSVLLKDGNFKDVYYYIAKNSWGREWGENGYIRIMTNPNGTEQHCKFAKDGFVATIVHEP